MWYIKNIRLIDELRNNRNIFSEERRTIPLKIVSVAKGSQADREGLRAGDRIIAINDGPARDCIDIMYYGADEDVRLTVHRGAYEFFVALDGEEDFGITFEPMKIKRCGNKCIFCFVDQNPSGMRKDIYLKDEDYRMSFLFGNYVTLTNLGEFDLQRIVVQHLSPLYVSVHATDLETRMKLLGLPCDDRLLENMDRLARAGITMHCQVVLCPGINDGDILERTIRDLRGISRNILSLVVVPVGLTGHRQGLYPIREVDEEDARAVIRLVDRYHDTFRKETGEGFVYCADELYLLAGLDIPDTVYYDNFPQKENGVGMVRDFLESLETLEERVAGSPSRSGSFVFVTGTSMAPFIELFTVRMSRFPGMTARTAVVENRFYGKSVTVSGLLAGRDIIEALRDVKHNDTVVLPPNCLNDSGVFMDDVAPEDIAAALGVKVIRGSYDPVALFL